ncbi:subclass B1 metallo-beta-lactamase [Parerythrobacter jejuensis]|uniref:beta-lactamase n=1 Tax=Parerythrobacter jejuensis TaxID=795812 RepID=A0A845B0X2_9SPHN|nr:subclass B1 metallo-beta-lactamase [Parerythrobacter jejuensis]MXP32638.1 subclass B1 metallo-beta-lactamase [Parerythrobacter jejuensis]
MIRKLAVLATALILTACIPGEIRAPIAVQEAERDVVRFGDISFTKLADGVWQHTSYLDLPGIGPVPSNGLLVVDGDRTLLVDTAWTDAQTDLILRWAETVLTKPVSTALVTHAHKDKMGGIAALHQANIATWAHPVTNVDGPANGFEPARNTFRFNGDGWATGAGAASFSPLKIYYPGGAHTADNITVGIPAKSIAFGGCMIKASSSRTLGNLADAVPEAYAQSVRNFDAAFPDAAIIAMSHSPAESRKAIARTIDLADDL